MFVYFIHGQMLSGVEEQGTHSEPLASGGAYARFDETRYGDRELTREFGAEARLKLDAPALAPFRRALPPWSRVAVS